MTDYTHDADEVEAVHGELGAHLVRLRRGGAVIAVFRPVTGDTFDVELLAPPGTALTVDGVTPDHVAAHPSQVRARHRLHLPPGRHEVTVASDHGEDTYVLLSRASRPDGTRVPVWSGDTAERWGGDHGTVSASDGELHFQSKPTGPLPTPGTYLATGEHLDGDWRAYDALELQVRNVEDRSVGVFVRFHAADGTSHESLNRTLWPSETATIRIPLRHVMVDLEHVDGVEGGLVLVGP